MTDDRFAGKSLPASRFAGDDGEVAPAVEAALRHMGESSGLPYGLVNALLDARVFVPVVAVLDEDETNAAGQRVDKASHMASVSMQSADGRSGLLAFTSLHSLATWDSEARPVPVTARDAAAAAISDGHEALVLDIASSTRIALQSAGLRALAQGRTWIPPELDDDLQAIVAAALESNADWSGSFALQPSDKQRASAVTIALRPAQHLSATEVMAAASRLAADLAGDVVILDRCCDGVAIAVST